MLGHRLSGAKAHRAEHAMLVGDPRPERRQALIAAHRIHHDPGRLNIIAYATASGPEQTTHEHREPDGAEEAALVHAFANLRRVPSHASSIVIPTGPSISRMYVSNAARSSWRTRARTTAATASG